MSNERVIEYTTVKLELDEVTTYSDHKKNRFSGNIKSIRVGRSSSPNAVFKVKLKEGDEIQLWPGRIINFSEKSLGAVFSWDSLPNEWAEIEISENTFFVAGDNQSSSGSSGGVAKEFRKSDYELVDSATTQILSTNEKRKLAIVYNNSLCAIYIGNNEEIDPSIGTILRSKTSIKIMPFEKREVQITGEMWAIKHPAFQDAGFGCLVLVEEFLS